MENFFKNKKPDKDKLKTYGFKICDKKYIYKTNILNNQFELEIQITQDGKVSTKLIDNESKELYTLHLLDSADGVFVGKVKQEYNDILAEISDKCFVTENLLWENSHKIIKYVKDKYNDDIEYLWEKFPRNGICRRKDNKKWYLAILSVKGTSLGLETEEILEVIDLRAEVNDVPNLIKSKNIYPAYHMNKKHWFTVILDGSVPLSDIENMIDKSYFLAKKK